MRRVLAVALLAVVVTAGCTAPGGQQPPAGTTTAESVETTDAGPTETTAADPTGTTAEAAPSTTEATRTPTEFGPTTTPGPRKGDQLLSVTQLNESQATKWNASKRATFDTLSEARQQVVKRAIDCDCNVELRGEFSFHDKDRIEVVRYDGRFYFLRVAIV